MSTHRGSGTHAGRVNAPNRVGLLIFISVFVAAFATQAAAQVRPIDLGSLPGFAQTEAGAISATGQVVGTAYTAGRDHFVAFSWTREEGMIGLGSLGGASSATGVNDSGIVIGSSQLEPFGPFHAFVWTATDGMVDLGAPPGQESFAVAVNAAGKSSGISGTTDGFVHVFVWSASDGMIDFGTLGGLPATFVSGERQVARLHPTSEWRFAQRSRGRATG